MGIRHEFSCRYTPEQNGVAKRKIWLVVEVARAILEEKSLPKFYWAEAVMTAVYIQNRISNTLTLRYISTCTKHTLKLFLNFTVTYAQRKNVLTT